MRRRILALAMLGGVVGCERSTQPFPFEAAGETAKTLTTQGGTLSAGGAASVTFDAGSLEGPLEVSVAEVGVPASMSSSGAVASAAFSIEPSGATLAKPASLELKFEEEIDPTRAWLASIVGITGDEVHELGSTSVDLAAGVVRSDIEQLGTFAVVIPEPSAVHPVQTQGSVQASSAGGASLLLPGQSTGSIGVDCGDPDNRCDGLTVSATQNLLDQVQDAALIYPSVEGSFTISGGSASGEITATASLRVQFQSGQAAENVEVEALLEPTAATVVSENASQVVLTNVRQTVSGGTEVGSASQTEITTLVIPKSGGNGTMTFARSFEISVSGGATETATVSIVVPVQLNP